MRRERKSQLRAIAISDILARWQAGQTTFIIEKENFKYLTQATDTEMTRFVLAVEDEVIKHTKAAFEVVKHLKTPTIRVLCQKLGDFEDRWWSHSLLVTRLDEFETLVEGWRQHYENLIMEWAMNFYKEMLEEQSYSVVLMRIQKGHDVYYTPKEGKAQVWDHINGCLEIWLRTLTGQIKGDLQAFVEDRQNIHTAPINAQTDAMLKLLFAVPVPAEQKTMAEIQKEWSRLQCGTNMVIDCVDGKTTFMQMFRTLADVRSWGSKSWVIIENDWLYRKALQHLWAKIKSYPMETRDELIKRLYEECHDAEEMCAQGHLARLANVMVGFDGNFKGEVSLQDRMAAISHEEISDVEKRAAATLVLDEFKVPATEREAWLDAF
jgi:hypothetical protein